MWWLKSDHILKTHVWSITGRKEHVCGRREQRRKVGWECGCRCLISVCAIRLSSLEIISEVLNDVNYILLREMMTRWRNHQQIWCILNPEMLKRRCMPGCSLLNTTDQNPASALEVIDTNYRKNWMLLWYTANKYEIYVVWILTECRCLALRSCPSSDASACIGAGAAAAVLTGRLAYNLESIERQWGWTIIIVKQSSNRFDTEILSIH